MGRRIGLTPSSVVDTAVEIADRDGLDGVTLAAVAGRLGVRSPSLYAHVEGLAGLRRALGLRAAAALASHLVAARRGRQGTAALRSVARAYRDFALAHPGLYAAAQQTIPPGKDDELYRAIAETVMPVVETLVEMGVAPADVIHHTRAIRSALHGFVSLERGNGFGMAVDFAESFDRLVTLLASGLVGTPG